jgi:transposase InsO family protein
MEFAADGSRVSHGHMWAKRMDSAGSRSGDALFRGAAGPLKPEIMRVHGPVTGVYGARKVWLALNREGIAVARCTVGQLMADLGLTGAVRGSPAHRDR